MLMFAFITIIVFVIVFIRLSILNGKIISLEKQLVPKSDQLVGEQPSIPLNVDVLNRPAEMSGEMPVPIKTNMVEGSEEVSNGNVFFENNVALNSNIVEPEIPKAKDTQSFEFKFGAKFFTIVGSIAITFGVGYFLKYAFDNNLITEMGRVLIGIVVGVLVTGLGIWLSKKYFQFGQILSGTGLGLVYLSVYSAYGFYHLVPMSVGLIGLTIVTIVGMTLAVVQNQMWMAIFSQIGAYLAPMLLLNGENNPHLLFTYIIAIILGTFGVAWFKLWRPLTLINFIATAILFFSWTAQFINQSLVGVAVTYLTILFAIFTAILFINYFIRKAEQNADDLTLLSINSLLTFVGYYFIVNPYYHTQMGYLALAFAALHFILILLVVRHDEASKRFREFLLAIGSIIFSLALPIIIESHSVLTIGWALEAAVLVFFGARLNSYSLRVIGLIVQAVVLFRVFLLDTVNYSQLELVRPFFNERFFTFLLVTVATAFIGWVYYANRDKISKDEANFIKVIPIMVAIQIFTFGTIEIHDFLVNYWLIVFWSLLIWALFTFGAFVRSTAISGLGFATVILTAIYFFVIGHGVIENSTTPFLNPYFGVLLFAAIIGALTTGFVRVLDGKNNVENKPDLSSYLMTYAFFALTVAISKEITAYDYSIAFLPVVWSLAGLALLMVGYYFKSKVIRFVTYAATMISAIYCLFHITNLFENLDYYLILNYRFMALVVVAIVSFLIVQTLRSRTEVDQEEKKTVGSVFSFIGNIFLLIGISEEVWTGMTRSIGVTDADSMDKLSQFKNVILSIVWALYGILVMIYGIYKRNHFSRIFGLSLIGIVIFKVFFVDTAGLETVYKILSYLSLGIILLISGFLYNKYKDRIMQFVK